MLTKTPRNKGFLLVEAMISITILLMVSATAITLLILANHAIRYNAHSLEAGWIAQEGINGVRGLRDTNWIRFSYDKELCWASISSTCPGSNMTAGQFYRLELTLSDPPELTSTTAAIDLEDGISASDNQYNLYKQTDGRITHENLIGAEPTIYYRQIEVETNNGHQIEAKVTVAWLEGQNQKSIQLPIILTNYKLEE